MYNPEYFGNFDVVQSLILSTFVLFFFGLIVYLRREDRREGYPLEDDVSGRLEESGGFFFSARPKVFRMASGEPLLFRPDGGRDSMDLNARRTSRTPGSPLVPVGNPLDRGCRPGLLCQTPASPRAHVARRGQDRAPAGGDRV